MAIRNMRQPVGCRPNFRKATGSAGPAARRSRLSAIGSSCSVQGFETGAVSDRGSSEVEHRACTPGVAGSTPVHHDPQKVSNNRPEGAGRPHGRSTIGPGFPGADVGSRKVGPVVRDSRRRAPSDHHRRRRSAPVSYGPLLPGRHGTGGRFDRGATPHNRPVTDGRAGSRRPFTLSHHEALEKGPAVEARGEEVDRCTQ